MDAGTSLYLACNEVFHDPALYVWVGGQQVDALSVTVDLGYDTVSSSATVRVGKSPPFLSFRGPVEIYMGWRGASPSAIPVFIGWIEDDQRGYFPNDFTIKAASWLRFCQLPYPSDISYSSQTDVQMVTDLIGKAGIQTASIAGAGQTFGTVKAVERKAGQTLWDLINELDQVTGYITYDTVSGVIRRRWAPIPTDSAMYAYVQGTNIISINRPRTVANVRNKVSVTGLNQDSTAITATAQADNPLNWWNGTQYYPVFDFRSDLIETTAYAETVALRKLYEVNRIVEEVDLEVPGNPYLQPGVTVSVIAEKVGILTVTPYWVKHVTHTIDSSGYICRLKLEGGAGEAGYLVPGDTSPMDPTGGNGGNPVAVFTTRVTAENMDTGGGAVDVYTVNCDGTGSFDPDGNPASLTYAWSNDQNATTGTGSRFGMNFTAAEWANSPVITLTVTDGDGNTGTSTRTVESGGSFDTAVLQRQLYVAAGVRAEASSDGGRTWNTWTPGGGVLVVSTPEIGTDGGSYFGLDDGKLYFTGDYLATTPTLVKDFGSHIYVIWVNEVDTNRVTVGLGNGEVWRTLTASALGSSTWTRLYDFGASAVIYLIESAANPGEYRVSAGTKNYRTFDDFANIATIHTFGTLADKMTLSNFSNYTVGVGTNPVRREDGTVITGTATNDVRAVTHHIRDDILYVADTVSGDGQVYEKAAGTTTLSLIGTISGSGGVSHLIRDGDSPLVMYLTAHNGFYKTVDGGVTWYQVRDYSAAGPVGYEAGYGSAPWQQVTAATVTSDTNVKAKSLWNGSSNDAPPSGWTNAGYDDTAWGAAVVATTQVGNPGAISGTSPIWSSTLPAADAEDTIFRKTFTLSSGIVSSATLTIMGDDGVLGVWINGINVYGANLLSAISGGVEVDIENTLLNPNSTNVIAVWGDGGIPTKSWVSFKLVIT